MYSCDSCHSWFDFLVFFGRNETLRYYNNAAFARSGKASRSRSLPVAAHTSYRNLLDCAIRTAIEGHGYFAFRPGVNRRVPIQPGFSRQVAGNHLPRMERVDPRVQVTEPNGSFGKMPDLESALAIQSGVRAV